DLWSRKYGGYICAFISQSRIEKYTAFSGRFNVISLDRPNFRVITLHMYNPYVTDEALMAFLARYAEVLTPRQFQVLLRTEEKGLEGLMHPPAQFNIGADKGYLFYSRQPPFCRSKGVWQCAQLGDTAKECSAPKSCHSCGSLDHLMRDCKNGRKQCREGFVPPINKL
uniref:CCHC-type domain-containing protein n=1 Tax=Sinocyclocheilus grahami TaxID=75366 RepID=A0A672M681_SINGR